NLPSLDVIKYNKIKNDEFSSSDSETSNFTFCQEFQIKTFKYFVGKVAKMSPENFPTPEDDLKPTQAAYQDFGEADDDDSDNESVRADGNYEGYEPLAMDENYVDYDNIVQMDGNDSYESDINTANEETTAIHNNLHLPPIESIDVEVQREIQSRHQELQIELDNNKTQQILNAMAGFNLPNAVVPDWAIGVSEDLWKEELLKRIREGTQASNKTKEVLTK
uniref:Male-enhanced antigen 1 n=1 Tax=Glossina brevipalpis TaxID=37001 RepID=A0A1A9WEW7_9MUSC